MFSCCTDSCQYLPGFEADLKLFRRVMLVRFLLLSACFQDIILWIWAADELGSSLWSQNWIDCSYLVYLLAREKLCFSSSDDRDTPVLAYHGPSSMIQRKRPRTSELALLVADVDSSVSWLLLSMRRVNLVGLTISVLTHRVSFLSAESHDLIAFGRSRIYYAQFSIRIGIQI